jgi:hypothetical protein
MAAIAEAENIKGHALTARLRIEKKSLLNPGEDAIRFQPATIKKRSRERGRLRSKASLASSLSILLGPIVFHLPRVFRASMPARAKFPSA